jgi:hypothetical protein
MSESQPPDWINSNTVFDLVRLARPGWQDRLEFRIRPGLEAGLIEATAKVAKVERRGSHGSRHTDTIVDWEVDKRVWIGTSENSSFSLFRDCYTSRAPGIGFNAVELVGISYRRGQLLDFLDIQESETERMVSSSPTHIANEVSSPPMKGGAPLDSEKWSNLVGVIAGYLMLHELKAEMKPGTLYKELSDYAAKIGASIPSKTTAIDAIKRALKWSAAQHDANGQPLIDKDGKPLRLD